PSASQVRLVRHRDRGCVFPGCGTNRYTQVHHVRWWRHGGKTDLENLALVCSLHHRLVHEHGWRLTRSGGRARWFRPDGERYRAGPGPP
ncbi:MAG TPA: HNH endonuclease signature motif containing protein, partial [Actinomycetota bacterium]